MSCTSLDKDHPRLPGQMVTETVSLAYQFDWSILVASSDSDRYCQGGPPWSVRFSDLAFLIPSLLHHVLV